MFLRYWLHFESILRISVKLVSVVSFIAYICVFAVLFESAIVEVSALDWVPDVVLWVEGSLSSRKASGLHVGWLVSAQ